MAAFMTLYQLRVFATIVKFDGFTRAAQALRISQPSISAAIHDLQEELDVKLFERLGNKSHLTEAGKRLYERAESALSTIEGIKEEIDQLQGLKRGTISVGGSALAAASFLPMAVQKFKKNYPGIEVMLKFQTGDNLEKMLLEGDTDLAIMSRRPRSPLLNSEPYREEEIVVIAPPRHRLAGRNSVPLKLLSKEQWIIYTKGTPVRDMIELKFSEAGLSLIPALEVDVQLGARDAIKSAVAGGLGISLLSKCHVLSDVKAGRLKLLKVSGLDLKQTLHLAVHKTRQSSSLIQCFIDLLRRYSKQD